MLALWPQYTESDLEGLKKQIRFRLDAVMRKLIMQYAGGGFLKFVLNAFLTCKKRDIVEMVTE
jgi:hypothetical protein